MLFIFSWSSSQNSLSDPFHISTSFIIQPYLLLPTLFLYAILLIWNITCFPLYEAKVWKTNNKKTKFNKIKLKLVYINKAYRGRIILSVTYPLTGEFLVLPLVFFSTTGVVNWDVDFLDDLLVPCSFLSSSLLKYKSLFDDKLELKQRQI